MLDILEFFNANNIGLHSISSNDDNKDMANGMRNTSGIPLTEKEITFVKSEIQRIQADETIFIFNDPDHLRKSTCYNFIQDKIYITRNVFPDELYASAHPRDTMSVGAVLAHEYYGHRHYRSEYLSDLSEGADYHTTPLWQDECRASLTAAQIAPGLTQIDRRDLVLDAVFRAKEFGQLIEMNDFMKEVVYGYKSNDQDIERNISRGIELPKYVSDTSEKRTLDKPVYDREMSKVWGNTRDFYDIER